MPGRTLIILGSGPGIGVSVAKTFCVRGFTHVALVSRDKKRLDQDEDDVLDAIRERGYSCQTKTWVCDLSDLDGLKKTFKELESFGSPECIFFNAARVAGKPPLEETTEQIEYDFRLTNLALYETAKWAVPLLKENAVEDRSPSLLVTSTTQLWREPVPALVALSMVKSAQRALVLSLNSHYGNDIHIGLVSVGGVVDPDKKNLSPDNIAEQAYALYRQPRDKWEREIEISDDE